jgi:hypothetical protein
MATELKSDFTLGRRRNKRGSGIHLLAASKAWWSARRFPDTGAGYAPTVTRTHLTERPQETV